MIESSEISVVIQGAFNNTITPKTIDSVKRYLPKAEIILSTWEGTSVPEGLSVDKILLNKDPGCYSYNNGPKTKKNNVNRQIVSTLSGLKTVKRKYTLKIRTDFILTGNNFLNYFDKYKEVNPKWQVFEKKLIACSFFTRIPEIYHKPFHLSDLIFFGLTKDILKLFDIPLMPRNEEFVVEYQKYLWNKFVPEQYIFCSCLKKNKIPFKAEHTNDLSKENIEQTHNYFANNFVFLSFKQYNIIPADSIVDIQHEYHKCYTLIRWEKLYRKYVKQDFVIEKKLDSVLINLYKIYLLHFCLRLICFIALKENKKVKMKLFIMKKISFFDNLFKKWLFEK